MVNGRTFHENVEINGKWEGWGCRSLLGQGPKYGRISVFGATYLLSCFKSSVHVHLEELLLGFRVFFHLLTCILQSILTLQHFFTPAQNFCTLLSVLVCVAFNGLSGLLSSWLKHISLGNKCTSLAEPSWQSPVTEARAPRPAPSPGSCCLVV